MIRKRILLAAVVLLIAAAGLSAQTTATMSLTGTVAAVYRITATQTVTSFAIDKAETGLPIGTITAKSNNRGGYKIAVTSLHPNTGNTKARLANTVDATEMLEYDVTVDGEDVTFSSSSFVITETSRTTGTGNPYPIVITYDGSNADLSAGSFTDTLTFTISAP